MTGSRSPNYWREGLPYVDGFELSIGVDQSVGILRVENGEADVTFYAVPNTDYPRLADDPVLAEQLFALAAFPNTDYIVLNVNAEPFNNFDVRVALDMAIDRDRLTQINNNRSVVANGMLPASMSGDNKELAPTEYNAEQAKELLAQAGYPDGFTMTLWTSTDSQQQSVAQAVADDWATIGVQAEITPIDPGQYINILVNQTDMQGALVQWWNDYVDPSNSYEALLKCDGSFNYAHFCNEELDKVFEAANPAAGDDRWNGRRTGSNDPGGQAQFVPVSPPSFYFRGAGCRSV
jgi:ABC-type transport system substrate-binding protein